MAMVPDLGSDFAQKLLLDLRRRRERLGFGSAGATTTQQQQRVGTPRDACSNSQKPLGNQRPQQAAPAPRSKRPEATTTTPRSSPGNATATAGKPRRRRDVAPVAAADARAIVPFRGEGGGGKPRHVVAGDVDVQQMAALALALRDGGKLRNIEVVARNGSVFFHQSDTAGHRRGGGAHAGNMAIGLQDLNDMLMAAYSSDSGRRRSDEAGKKLFGGSMNMEEALSMLVMLQDASGYMEGSESGKVLLLKGKENRESSATTRSPRIVEIVDEESETESNASMQIVVHNKFLQSHQSLSSSSVMQSGPSDSKINSISEGEKEGSKVRMPSVIAKLMGLENLPSSAKTVPEHKGTERFVKPESVARMEIKANATDRKLPIRIVASEKVLSNGQHRILLPGVWNNSLTSFGESELSKGSSHPATGNKQVRLTMKEVLRKMVGAERDESQGVDERIIHEDKALTEEIKLQKSVSVGCRNDSGKKMDFLKRFRKNSDSKPAMEDKHIAEEKSTSVGKKQATGMKRLWGRDSEAKSRRAREKLNKENLATAKTKAVGKNGKADKMRRQAQGKHIDRQTMTRKAQNCRETQSKTPSRNLEDKKLLMSEAAHMRKKTEYTVVTQREDEEHPKVNDIGFSKLSDSTHGDRGSSEQLAVVVRDSSTTGAASSDEAIQKITEGASDTTIPAPTVLQASEDLKFLDQNAIAEIVDEKINQTASETTEIPVETCTKEEQQQQQHHHHHQQQEHQQVIVKEQLTDGPDHTTTCIDSTGSQEHATHVVSYDSFTHSQLLLVRILAKDRYLLETAKGIVRVRDPVSFVNDTGAQNWSDKGNYDLLSDVAREVIRRKGKRTEAMEEVSVARTASPKLRCLDDLVRELDCDVESLQDISRESRRRSGNGVAEGLQRILQSDIQNDHPDANTTWDFGWNRVSELPIENNEVVKDLEKNILGGIITDMVRDLIAVSVQVRHGCCPCVA